MEHKYTHISYVYHFFSEIILAFLFMVPFMYYVYEWVPYWRYLALACVACCLLFMWSGRVVRTIRIVIVIPTLIILFLLWGFPITLSILFPLVFMWRYLNIINASILGRENSYIKVSLGLATIYTLVIQDVEIIIYTFGLFIVLMFGYMLGHMKKMEKQQRHLGHQMFTYTALTISAGVLITYLAYDIIKWVTAKLWLAYGYVMIVLGDVGIRLMEMGGFEFPEADVDNNLTATEGNTNNQLTNHSETKSFMTGDVATYIYVGIAIFIGIIFIWYIYRLLKKQPTSDHQTIPHHVSYDILSDNHFQKQSIFKRLFHRHSKKPAHTVRKMVYDLERRAERKGQGRHPFETVENWLGRFNIQADMSVYERVRYGGEHVSDKEIEALQKELEAVELNLREQRKGHK